MNKTIEDTLIEKEIDLFSVIVLHYNQQDYINEALDSVFNQDYSNIELIIADDASVQLDTYSIKSYIETHRTKQIKSVKYQFLAENGGTVKNVNQALKAASGKYAMFFAADDSLYDSQVLSNFFDTLSTLPSDQYMVCAQCNMMEENMKKKIGNFVNVSLALNMNRISSFEQYKIIAFSCTYAMGATAFRMDMLNERGYFNENYKIIEDWSYYLDLTLNGSKIIYADFDALKHRDGGVSHFNQEVLPPQVIEYRNDSIMIQERLILPHLSKFPIHDQVKLMDRYDRERNSFATLYTNKPRPSRITIARQNKKFYAHKLVWWLMDHLVAIRQKSVCWTKRFLYVFIIMRIFEIIATTWFSSVQFIFLGTKAYKVIACGVIVLLFVSVFVIVFTVLISLTFFIRKILKLLLSKKL